MVVAGVGQVRHEAYCLALDCLSIPKNRPHNRLQYSLAQACGTLDWEILAFRLKFGLASKPKFWRYLALLLKSWQASASAQRPDFWRRPRNNGFCLDRLASALRPKFWPRLGLTSVLDRCTSVLDRCHTCNFIARFCRATLSRDKIASVTLHVAQLINSRATFSEYSSALFCATLSRECCER